MLECTEEADDRPGISVLQTLALPLGDDAGDFDFTGNAGPMSRRDMACGRALMQLTTVLTTVGESTSLAFSHDVGVLLRWSVMVVGPADPGTVEMAGRSSARAVS